MINTLHLQCPSYTSNPLTAHVPHIISTTSNMQTYLLPPTCRQAWAIGSHAIGGMGNYGRVALLMTGTGPWVRTPSGAWATMGALLFQITGTGPWVRTPSGAWATMGELLFLKDRPGAVCSHAFWGHGHLWTRCSSQRPARGRLVARHRRHGQLWASCSF
jgi:hypothetical protein